MARKRRAYYLLSRLLNMMSLLPTSPKSTSQVPRLQCFLIPAQKTNPLGVRIGDASRAKTPMRFQDPSLYDDDYDDDDDDSLDELANNQLLPGWSEGPSPHSPLRNVTAVDSHPSNPDVIMSANREKPLPELPRQLSTTGLSHPQMQYPGSQTRSPRVIRKGERPSGRSKISQPVPVVVDNLSRAGLFAASGHDHPRGSTMLKRSATDLENLSSKIDIFVDPATPREGEPATGKGNAGIERASAGLSPLQRGRHVLALAGRAIAGRISRSTSTSGMGDMKLGLKGDSLPGSSNASMSSLRPNTGDDSNWASRHHRRIAEGENLGRAKVQAMISDGQVREARPPPAIRTLPPASRQSLSHLVINGLAQHPDTMVFVPNSRVGSHSRVAGEDDGSVPASHDSRPRVTSIGNMSVKRKSATRDLRSQVTLALKRTKRGSAETSSSTEDPVVGPGSSQRSKPERASVISRERNRLSLLFNNNKTSIELTDAESSKENDPISVADDKTWAPRRGSGGKKSSTSRRLSLFGRGSSGAPIQSTDPGAGGDDDMAIDELQNDDQIYRVGEKKR